MPIPSKLFLSVHYKATDEKQTAHRESNKAPGKREESQLQISVSMKDIRYHQQELLNILTGPQEDTVPILNSKFNQGTMYTAKILHS